MIVFINLVIITNVQHYFNLFDLSKIFIENEVVRTQQTQLTQFLHGQ
jgi:hypothetical protein